MTCSKALSNILNFIIFNFILIFTLGWMTQSQANPLIINQELIDELNENIKLETSTSDILKALSTQLAQEKLNLDAKAAGTIASNFIPGTSVAMILDVPITIYTTLKDLNEKSSAIIDAYANNKIAHEKANAANLLSQQLLTKLKNGEIIDSSEMNQLKTLRESAVAIDKYASSIVDPLKTFNKDEVEKNLLTNSIPLGSTYSFFKEKYNIDPKRAASEAISAVQAKTTELTINIISNSGLEQNIARLLKEQETTNAALQEASLEMLNAISETESLKKELEKQQALETAANKKALAEQKAFEKHIDKMDVEFKFKVANTEKTLRQLSRTDDPEKIKTLLKELDNHKDDWKFVRKNGKREIKILSHVVKAFESPIKTYEVSYMGRTYKPSQLKELKTQLAEWELMYEAANKGYRIIGDLDDYHEDRLKALTAVKDMENRIADTERKISEAKALIAQKQQESERLLTQKEQSIASDRPRYISPIDEDFIDLRLPTPPVENPQRDPSNQNDETPIEIVDSNLRDSITKDNNSDTSDNQNSNSTANLYEPTFMVNKFRQLPMHISPERANIHNLIKSTFGSSYVLADWNDVVSAYNSDSTQFTEDYRTWKGSVQGPVTAFPAYKQGSPAPENYRNLMVSKDGNLSASRSSYNGKNFNRIYFMDYFDGTVPSYYGLYGQVGGNDFVLGSWYGTRVALVKKLDNSSDYKFDLNKGPTTSELWSGNAIYWENNVISQKSIALGLDPNDKEIDSVSIDSSAKTVYQYRQADVDITPSKTQLSSYYYGKNFMGVSYGDAENFDDVNSDFGWFVTSPDNDLANYDYTSWGEWQENTSYSTASGAATFTEQGAQWIAGSLTPGDQIPTSSSATYTGTVQGLIDNGVSTQGLSGNANLTANFGNRTLTGTFNNMQTNNNAWQDLNVNAGWNNGVNSITGTVTGSTVSGTVKGNFFGPSATEMGGTWQASGGSDKAAGIFRAKKN